MKSRAKTSDKGEKIGNAVSDPGDRDTIWHIQHSTDCLESLGSAIGGLSASEASRRLSQYGPNQLSEKKSRPLWLKFFDQFKSVLTLVLLAAGGMAWAIGDLKDAIVILIVVFFNACLGFYQEHRAERTLAALRDMLVPTSRALRDGEVQEIKAADLVPGDIVLLQSGEQVPADGRILDSVDLEAQEAALTGESLSVPKQGEALNQGELPPGERSNMLFMNTMVTRGHGQMLVVATGMRTEMGRIADMISGAEEGETPLQRQLDALGKRLAAIAVAVIGVIFGLNLWRGEPWAEAAMTAVALAVAAVPEGLPAVVTVTLAIGMWRMAKKKAVLKKLASVETLGSTTVICTDKTGTLTLNEMTARAGWYGGTRFQVDGDGYSSEGSVSQPGMEELFRPLALCNEARIHEGNLIGDPTEGALFALAQKGGLDPDAEQERLPRIAEIPFDSEYKFMATFHQAEEEVMMLIKGAPDVLLDRSSHWLAVQDGEVPLYAETRKSIEEENNALAGRAFRVLAVARRTIPAADFDSGDLWKYAREWTFLGMVGLMDPPRQEAKSAIEKCRKAGIDVKMITGDHKTTAAAIARELGLKGEVLTGSDLDEMEASQLSMRTEDTSVFARVSPEHKVKIVEALKKAGHVTAMTGDGVNDAPALKTADIGVAMGTGTAVTKEAATLVLTDDNFVTIQHAVEEGRLIYDNIVKFVRFQLSTNIAAILTVLASTLLGLPMPFTAIQLLWINIIMDGPPAMTLGVEPARPGLMDRPPRKPGSHILTLARFARLLGYGIVMTVGTLAVFQYGLSQGNREYGVTLAFTVFVLFQFFNVFNARAEVESAFNSTFLRNGKLWLALLLVLALQVLVVYWQPARELFGTVSLSVRDWLLCTLVASSVLVLDEIYKLGRRLYVARFS